MKPVESVLKSTDGFINSFTRNTLKGWWELEIGIPVKWVFDENSKIGCEVIFENDLGKLIKIFPKENKVVVDDLIEFVEIIIKTNEVIAEKEKEFKESMNEMKEELEKKAKIYYKELDELRENSFKKNNESFTKTLNIDSKKVTPKASTSKPKTVRKPRIPKKTTAKTITEETEVIESNNK